MKIFLTLEYLFFLLTLTAVINAQPVSGVVSINVDEQLLTLPCAPGIRGCGTGGSKDFIVDVTLKTGRASRNSELKYEVTYGTVIGKGATVRWNLADQQPGTYRITVRHFLKGKQIGKPKSAIVTIESDRCICDCVCPTVDLYGPDKPVKNGDVAYFTASISGGPDVTYNWTVENAEILSGQGTPELIVRVKSENNSKNVKATVELGGLDPFCNCPRKASATALIIP